MNMETFAANEYVAACWVLTCNRHGSEVKYGDSSGNISGLTYSSNNNSKGYYTGTIRGSEPDFLEGTKVTWGGIDWHYSHSVTISSGANGGAYDADAANYASHPNASN